MSSAERSGEIEQLLAKQALHELNTAYCRAVDRLDETALVDLFCSTAVIDSGVLRGAPEYFSREFAIWVRKNSRVIFHAITNEWFVINGASAIGESYVLALSRVHGKNSQRDILTAGRYLDKFQCKDNRWLFSERRFVLDHSATIPADTSDPVSSTALSEGHGCFAPNDPVYAFWKQLQPRH
jgi:SnoaL-like protein